MKTIKICNVCFILVLAISSCERNEEDFSGTYCLNIENLEMTIVSSGNNVTFTLQPDLLQNGTGTVEGDTLILTAIAPPSEIFSGKMLFSKDRRSFTGPFYIRDNTGVTTMEGIMTGVKGVCPEYDIDVKGVPEFVEKDFTQLSRIERISKFRSGFGHSYTDGAEACRSMKHYFNPYPAVRQNNTIEIYSPVKGTILLVTDDGHGASTGLTNKQVQIKSDDQPAFVFVLFHCDLLSGNIVTGKRVEAGEMLGHARMYYDDLKEYATSFDIAVWVSTPSGARLISYFETLKDHVLDSYLSRGAVSEQDFIISRDARDADPLQCDGETFLTSGNINNWVILN